MQVGCETEGDVKETKWKYFHLTFSKVDAA